MKLADYRAQKKLTLKQIAALIGCTDATVSRIERGLHRPDWDTMAAIERATDGAVTPNDFREAAAESESIPEAAPRPGAPA